LAQNAGDLLFISLAGGDLGGLFLEQGDYEKAQPLLDQALEIDERLQFRFGLASALISSGALYLHQGDYIRAEQFFEKSVSVSRDLGLNWQVSFNSFLFGLIALLRNDYSSAMLRFQEYFHAARVFGEEEILCRFLIGMSAVAGGINHPERCARLSGAAQVIIETSDFRMHQFDRAEFDRHIQIARDQLGNATFEMLSNEGRTMTIEQAIELATKTKID
jgi:tetratricopeptide (TPR) repeat protein